MQIRDGHLSGPRGPEAPSHWLTPDPMSGSERRRPAESPSCPLLGLPDDPDTRFSFPSVAHRCRATEHPRPIDLAHQGAFCLATTYPDCPRYQAAAAPRRSGGVTTAPRPADAKPGDPISTDRVTAEVGPAGTPGLTGAAGAIRAAEAARTSGSLGTPDRPAMPWTLIRSVSPGSPKPTDPLAPTDRSGRTDPPKAVRGRRAVVVVIAIAVLAVLAVAAYLASPAMGDWLRQTGTGAPAASPLPLVSRSATPAATLGTTQPTPSGRPDPSPGTTPPAGAMPTAAPTPVRTRIVHVVTKGEYLIGIAARYGVPVDAIISANRLKDPSLIYVGERLVIPPP